VSETKAIGGYFGLQENNTGIGYYPHLLALNTGRNAFEHILLLRRYKKVYLPYFTCDVLLEPLKKHAIEIVFYKINELLEPVSLPILDKEDAFLYTNYFGIKSNYINYLATGVKQLIIDNAQAFFVPPVPGVDTFYSPRKFFGVPDGAYVTTENKKGVQYERDHSTGRFSHLLLRVDSGASAGYEDFKKNDAQLSGQPIKLMSKLTKNLLSNINYEEAKGKRNANFQFLHKALAERNQFQIQPEEDITGPMVYPFRTTNTTIRKRLIDNNIFVATYWPNVFNWLTENEMEYKLSREIIPLPVDQRYNENDLNFILQIIHATP